MNSHRKRFPGLAGKAYFNFGGQGVLPDSALEAISESYRYVQEKGPFSTHMFGWLDREATETKQALALEFGGSPDCFALTQNATEGCNIVIWGMRWQEGDNIVLSDAEHPGVHAAVLTLARRMKLEVSLLPVTSGDSLSALSAIVEEKPRTRLVVLSQVLWNNGRTLPIDEMQKMLTEKGIRLLVDSAQSAGVMPFELAGSGIDYFAFTGHKWLCGPEGLGALYVRKELIQELEPTFVGWRGVFLSEDQMATAARFEVATCPFPLMSGLRAALECHRMWSENPQARYVEQMKNIDKLREKLESMPNIEILTPVEKGVQAGGLLTFRIRGTLMHMPALKKLEAAGVYVRTVPFSTPDKPEVKDALRASVHYFNDADDIERLARALAD